MNKGYLTIILHAHLPFVRHPEYEESLEENWLYEAITDTYIPLLLMMDNLVKDRIDFRLCFNVSPTLASMFADPLLQSRYLERIERLIDLGKKEIKRTRSKPKFNALAIMYYKHFQQVRKAFVERYGGNLINAFNRLQEIGKIEIIASAATHGYLPILSVNESAVRAQIKTGVEYYKKIFGRRPKGFWLPECGYYSGADALLAEQGIRYTILETHALTRARPRPEHGIYAPLHTPSGVAVFGRDPDSSRQVWSATEGYPGDYDYREFYRDIAYDLDTDYIKPYIHRDGIRTDTGFKYFRITGKGDQKEVYNPKAARDKARIHAAHFISSKESAIKNAASFMKKKPVIVAPFDAELFGHWWHEGPLWLDYLIRRIDSSKNIRLITPSDYLKKHRADNDASIPHTSSWGNKGFSETWINGSNDWIYRHLHQAAFSMEMLAGKYPLARGIKKRALKQAARELLLAQSSDWAFMINTGAMTEYATLRTKNHILRLIRLAREIESGSIDEKRLSAIEKQDNIFPDIDYRWFR